MDRAWADILPAAAEWRTTAVGDATAEPPLGRGPRGEPLWPTGRVGSITHAGGLRTVVTVPADRISALGIDMEPLTPLPPTLWKTLFDGDELDEVLHRPAPQRGFHALERWCLKEAAFKALRGRIPLEALPMQHRDGHWHPAPALQSRLERLGHSAHSLVLCTAATDGWQRASATLYTPSHRRSP